MIFTIIALVDGSDKELATEKDINSHRYELLVDGISGDITVDFDKIMDLVTEHSSYKYVFKSIEEGAVSDRADAINYCFTDTKNILEKIVYEKNKNIPQLSTGDIYTRCNDITTSMKNGKQSNKFPFKYGESEEIEKKNTCWLFC
tara:strand:+ start:53 stop:487 length:435 start_codon:yes stop_codon:yes gene_type:complete